VTFKRKGPLIFFLCCVGLVTFSAALLLGKIFGPPAISRGLGVGILIASSALLTVTVERWAAWYSGLCLVVALVVYRFLFLSVVGNAPGEWEHWRIVLEYLLLFVIQFLGTYRFFERSRKGRLDKFALLTGVVAMGITIVEPLNAWPLRIATVCLTIAWLIRRAKKKRLRFAHPTPAK
jgi:hypothetical protein